MIHDASPSTHPSGAVGSLESAAMLAVVDLTGRPTQVSRPSLLISTYQLVSEEMHTVLPPKPQPRGPRLSIGP